MINLFAHSNAGIDPTVPVPIRPARQLKGALVLPFPLPSIYNSVNRKRVFPISKRASQCSGTRKAQHVKRSRQQLQVTTGSLGKRRSCKIGKYAIIVAALLGSSRSVLALDDGRFANDPLKNWFDNLRSENRHGMRILCCETQRRGAET